MKQLNILAISDIHYIGAADHVCTKERRKATQALDLILKVFNTVDMKNIDLILILGDLVDNGLASGSIEDMETLKSVLDDIGKPFIVIPGNHDEHPENVFKVFGEHEGLHEFEGYQFITFSDFYNKDNTCDRCIFNMKEFFSKVDINRPVITLQHNAVYPPINHPYPHNISNGEAIIDYYSKKGVVLSISGHAHWGIPKTEKGGVWYLTLPALCEEPFKYNIITLKDNEVDVNEYSLSI